MSASRDKDTADYDLERFTEMFDQAMTSSDPRVKNALRQLMMMVILTDTGDHEAEQRANRGPLRQMQEDIRDQFRWIQRLEHEVKSLKHQIGMNEGQAKAPEGWQEQIYTSTSTIPSMDHWKTMVAQTNQLKQHSVLNNLNIKIAKDTDA